MKNQHNLEEIFWKYGKFVKKSGEEVNPKPIGNPVNLITYNRCNNAEELKKVQIRDFNLPEDVNAYIQGFETSILEKKYVPIQFYHIDKEGDTQK